MSEEKGQGLSRRDLLKRGAALGGAVVWATPIVQTLGMGRAFAQTASPTTTTTPEGGQDISYIGFLVDCGESSFFIKWESNGAMEWEEDPGAAPLCADKEDLPQGMDGGGLGFGVTPLTGSCAMISIPSEYENCDITVWVKSGQDCNTYPNAQDGDTVCSV